MENEEMLVLASVIEDIQHELAILAKDLPKATCMIAPARRCRVISLNLEKLFKKFRKLSCALGLK